MTHLSLKIDTQTWRQENLNEDRHHLIQALFQDSPMALFCFRMDGQHQMSFPLVNDEFLKLMPNVVDENGEVKAKDIFNSIHPDNLDEFLTKISKAYKHTTTFSTIVKTFDQFGEIKFRKVMAIPFKKIDSTVYWNGSVEDYSEHMELELNLYQSKSELREINNNYKTILDNSNDIIQSIDASGDIRFVNNQWLGIMGYTCDEVIGQSIFKYIHPDCLDRCLTLFDEIKNGREFSSTNVEFKTKQGKKLYTSALIIANYKGPQFTGTQGFFKNITIEMETGELLSNALININDGYCLLNNEFIVQEWNKACELISGKPKSKVIGNNIFEIFTSNKQSSNHRLFYQLISSPNSGTIEIYSHQLEKWLCISKTIVNDGISVFIQDISEKKRTRALLEIEKNLYLKMANNPSLAIEDLLMEVIRGIKQLHPKMIVSTLRLEGNKLYNWVSPDLSMDYLKHIEGMEIGISKGSCGTAAYRKENIIVADISTSPLWPEFKNFALQFNLKSCWSFPLLKDVDYVVGTLAIYHETEREIAPAELDSIERLKNLTYNLIELKSAQKRQQKADYLKSKIIDSTLTSIIISNNKDQILLFNPMAQKMFGWKESEVLGKNIFEILFSETNRNAQLEKLSTYLEKNSQHLFNKTIELTGNHKDLSDIELEAMIVSNIDEDDQINIFFLNDLSGLKNQFNIIEAQNQQLREIAWMQSHTVRAPLVRIMGLINLLESNHQDYQPKELIALINQSANELDNVIHEISNKTYELENGNNAQVSKILHVGTASQKDEHTHLKIILIDDDPLICYLNKLALYDNGFKEEIDCFVDGSSAIEYMSNGLQPSETILIFLDIYMPVMDGWAFLDVLQTLPIKNPIEVVILTSSSDLFEKEKARSYPNVLMYLEKELTSENITEIKKVINYNSFFI